MAMRIASFTRIFTDSGSEGNTPRMCRYAANVKSLGGLLDRALLARRSFLIAISRLPPVRKRVREPVEIEIHHRGCEQRERLADDQAADHRAAARRRHEDRTKPQQEGVADRF